MGTGGCCVAQLMQIARIVAALISFVVDVISTIAFTVDMILNKNITNTGAM